MSVKRGQEHGQPWLTANNLRECTVNHSFGRAVNVGREQPVDGNRRAEIPEQRMRRLEGRRALKRSQKLNALGCGQPFNANDVSDVAHHG